MRAQIYDVVGMGFILGSGYFFYRTVGFLAHADYVAGMLGLIVALLVVRAGVDVARLGVAARGEERR